MKYNIPAIATPDLAVAEAAMIGAEVTVLASYDEFVSVGSVQLPAAGSGVLNPDTTYADPGQNIGYDLALIANGGIKSATQIVVTLAVTLDDGSSNGVNGTAVGTFNTPEGDWAENQTFNMPTGMATDLVTSGGNLLKVRKVNGILSIVGGVANTQINIYALPGSGPGSTGWFDISCAMQKDPTLPVTKSHPIRCGYNASRFVKMIPGDPGKLALTTKRRSYGDGLERLNGSRVSIQLLIQKDNYLLCERQIYGGLRFAASPKFPDADAEADVSAESFFETFAVFV